MAKEKSPAAASSAAGRRDAKRASGSSSRRTDTLETRKYKMVLAILAALCVACAGLFWPLDERITQGLDIRGGVSVIMTARTSDGTDPSAEDMATATTIVQNRVNALGASEATVQQQGTNSILIQIPGATDAEMAVETIGRTGHLEFVRLDDIGDADALAEISLGKQDVVLDEGTYTAFMDGSHIRTVAVAQPTYQATGEYVVNLTLDDEGRKQFAEVTTALAPTRGRIAIVLDGVVNSAPAVQSPITDGSVQISGDFTLDEALSLKTVLDSGSLPVTLEYSESRVVGPTLGQDSLRQGVFALSIGMVLVAAYLFFFYRGLGFLTFGSLAVFAIVYLGILAGLSRAGAFALSLPGIAGVVLTVGMAADSSILVLERFREEIRMGRSVRNASLSGVRHGIATSLDADAVTFVSALALFFFAVGPVKGFGLTMMLGIICDIITMFLFKAPALRMLANGTIQANPGFWGIAEDLQEAADKKDGKAVKGGVANA
ncbi:MAG: protein translocase subunit SecD [Atopobiaceae bacterium]|nr:protein translocase subunit SecD [Atopobiaceae bacterium]